jgi:hypothetical protein
MLLTGYTPKTLTYWAVITLTAAAASFLGFLQQRMGMILSFHPSVCAFPITDIKLAASDVSLVLCILE